MSETASRFFVLSGIQFRLIREYWIWNVVMALLFPLATLAFLHSYSGAHADQLGGQIAAGNIVFALALNTVVILVQDLADQRRRGDFDYYASLPVGKLPFVLSILMRATVFALPAAIGIAVLAHLMYGTAFELTWAVLPFSFLAVLSTVGIGALLGFLMPNPQVANMATNGLLLLITFLSPVMVPSSALPAPLRLVSLALPTTYVAQGLRRLLFGIPALPIDWLMLSLFVVGSLVAIARFVSWRAV